MTQNNKTMVAWDLILPSKLSELMTPKIRLQRYILCTRLPENKTTVENKAYNLPSDVIKLMASKTCSVHTKKQSFMERWLFKIKNPHCTETWKYFSKVLWQYLPDLIGTRKLPCPTWGGTDGVSKGDIYSRKRSSPPPLSSFDYNKNVTHWVLGAGQP